MLHAPNLISMDITLQTRVLNEHVLILSHLEVVGRHPWKTLLFSDTPQNITFSCGEGDLLHGGDNKII